jgi:hypothetical protein
MFIKKRTLQFAKHLSSLQVDVVNHVKSVHGPRCGGSVRCGDFWSFLNYCSDHLDDEETEKKACKHWVETKEGVKF